MKEHKGAEVVGVTGFCWGGMIAMKAASMGAEAEGGVKAAANVHPAMITPELAEDVSIVTGNVEGRARFEENERARERLGQREREKAEPVCGRERLPRWRYRTHLYHSAVFSLRGSIFSYIFIIFARHRSTSPPSDPTTRTPSSRLHRTS